MPNYRFIAALIVISLAVGYLLISAVESSAKAVVTVSQLRREGTRNGVRLGARVADVPFKYRTEPNFQLAFTVEDPGMGAQAVSKAGDTDRALLKAEYLGVKPDTFAVGRDVILEGDFDGEVFRVKTLMTQCPSKYQPPELK